MRSPIAIPKALERTCPPEVSHETIFEMRRDEFKSR
jgi:hypothetical protein